VSALGSVDFHTITFLRLDLPGIVEGASAGRGRGRQVVSTAKTSDLIIMMLDATKSEEQRRLLEIELDAVGIRLNKTKPDGMSASWDTKKGWLTTW